MRNARYRFLMQMAGAASAAAFAPLSFAQRYPDKSIRLVVPFSAGAGADTMARVVGEKLGAPDHLGQHVVVDNRPGAGGLVASQIVSSSSADGYTLLLANVGPNAIDVSLRPKTNSAPQQEFAPVTQIASTPLVLCCSGRLKEKNFKDVMLAAKASSVPFSYASAGVGSIAHLATELFKPKVGIEATHVPYQGTASALTDLIAGRVQLLFTSTVSVLPYMQTGQLTALAIADAERSLLLPDVPTMAQCGVNDFEVSTWYGVVAPKATPTDITMQLYKEIAKILQLPDIRQRFASIGAKPIGSDPAAFGIFIDKEIVRWAEAVRISGARTS